MLFASRRILLTVSAFVFCRDAKSAIKFGDVPTFARVKAAFFEAANVAVRLLVAPSVSSSSSPLRQDRRRLDEIEVPPCDVLPEMDRLNTIYDSFPISAL